MSAEQPQPGSGAALPVASKTQTEIEFDEKRRRIGLVVGPLVFLLTLAWPFESLTPEGHRLAAVMALVIVFWMLAQRLEVKHLI